MPDLPWVAVADRDPTKDYVVLLTYLPLKRLTSTPAFLRDVQRIRGQLSRASGLIGYSMRARPLRREYWTLSVWDGERALLDFVRHRPHSDVMSALRNRMGPTDFLRWRIGGSAPLPTWDDAMTRRTSGG